MLHCALAARNICSAGHLAGLGHDVGVVQLGLGAQVSTRLGTHVVVLLAVPAELLGALEAPLVACVVAARADLLLTLQHTTSDTLK